MFMQCRHTLRNHATHLLRVSDHFVDSDSSSGLVLGGLCTIVGTDDEELARFGDKHFVFLALRERIENG